MPMQNFLANILAKMMEERKRRIEVEPLQQNGNPDWFERSPLGQDLLGDTSEPSDKWFADSPAGKSLYPERLPQVSSPSPDISVEQLKMAAQSPRDEPGISEQVYAPEPPLSAPEDDPGEYLRNYASNMDPDALRRIREEAFIKGKARDLSANVDSERPYGPQGQFRGGGPVSQQEMSPEIEMRLAARDRWKEGQPMRDQEYLASPEMARRNPELAAAAGKTLTDMQSNKAVERQQQLQNSLADKLGGGSGVIPFEQAMKLRLSGVQIPPQIMGMSPDEASSRMEAMLNYQNRSLSNIDPMEAIADPIKGVDLKNNRLAMSIIQDANTRIQQGENRDAVYKELMDDLMQLSSINISQKQKIAAEIQSQLAKSPTSDK